MSLTIVDHPIAEHVLATLRDKNTSAYEYRINVGRIASIVLMKALETLPTEKSVVETPLASCVVKKLKGKIVFTPVLRAGLSLLNTAIQLVPEASIGYFGLQRNEETALPEVYYEKIPVLNDAHVFLLDPMLATGGSAAYSIESVMKRNPKSISLVSIVSSEEGIKHIQSRFPEVKIYTVAVDEILNERKFIVPGLGDFGDRFHGTLK